MNDTLSMNVLMEDYFSAFRSLGFSSREKLAKEWGFDKVRWGAFFLRRAILSAPTPIPANDLGTRWSYYPDGFFHKNMLEPYVEMGFLTPEYAATEKALDFGRHFHTALNEDLANLKTLPDEELQRLLGLLLKASDYISALDKPHHPEFDLYAARKFDPSEKLNKQVYDLMGVFYLFRDDSHVAAWYPSGLAGQEWDALTYLWEQGASSVEALGEQLNSDKGFSKEAYAAALQTLADKGWAEENEAGVWQLTAAGKKVRDDVETQTDANFDLIFEAFSDTEKKEFVDLLVGLTVNLQKQELQA